MSYIGRFAPSPTGPLHAGSLAAALASWLDARAHRGRWLLRLEDVDTPRCVPGADAHILRQLQALGLTPDEAPWRQSQRAHAYAAALQGLLEQGDAYHCACTRKEVEAALATAGRVHEAHAELVYPGTCRHGLAGRVPRAVRLRTCDAHGQDIVVSWRDRRAGPQQQNVTREVGDFVLRRADGLWAYQLAVVVDDAAQGITDIVRGADLADNTPRQILLQCRLGLPRPRHLHVPLVLGDDGRKLSKQHGAPAIDVQSQDGALRALAQAAMHLGLPETLIARACAGPATVSDWLAQAVEAWRALHLPGAASPAVTCDDNGAPGVGHDASTPIR
jgi:glutamyl-Q tRNA(Asp) synthetase